MRATRATVVTCLIVATLAWSQPARAACRVPPVPTDTDFEAGSLIIDMGLDTCGGVKPLGLVWYLLSFGIRVSWVWKAGKATLTEADLASMSVEPYSWATSWDTFGGAVTKSFSNGPFVIPAGDAEAALRLIYEGVLPQEPTWAFGWSNEGSGSCTGGRCPGFKNDVKLYRTTGDFTAPVIRTATQPPRKLMLYASDKSWMDGVFEVAGLGFNSGAGTPTASGAIYDLATTEADVNTYLSNANYSMLWVAHGRTITAPGATVGTFVSGGGGLIASGGAALMLDNMLRYISDAVAPAASLTADNWGNGPAVTPANPTNPITGLPSGMDYKTLGADPQGFIISPNTRPCVATDVMKASGGYAFVTRDDTTVGGFIGYIGGQGSYGNNCNTNNQASWQRSVLQIFLTAGQYDPYHGELTRSSPIVVESPGGTVISFQGSMVMPPRASKITFKPATAGAWVFPARLGHERAYDLTSSPDFVINSLADIPGFKLENIGALWDAAPDNPPRTCASNGDCPGQVCTTLQCTSHVPSSGRNVYTFDPVSGTNAISRRPFSTAVAADVAALRPLLAAGSTTISNDTIAGDLINGIRAGQPGGVDMSTPAYIGGGDSLTFATAGTRPVVVYAAARDGMLHAFKVPDIEAANGPWTWTDKDELWAFIPRDQLRWLKSNTQVLQASPCVADVYGTVLETDGSPSAALAAASRNATKEWVTILALPTYDPGTNDGSLVVLDISNPDPAAAECPQEWSGIACKKGPNPLWSRTGVTGKPMGRATGAAMGVIYDEVSTPKTYRAVVFVTSDLPEAATGTGGMRLFAFDAATGDNLWPTTGALTIQYARSKPAMGEPNEPPAPPVLLDKSGGTFGYQTDLYFSDWEGRIWRVTDIGKDPPVVSCIHDATANGACAGITNPSPGTWGSTTSGTITRPISAPMVAYFLDGQLHLVAATGGAYWAPITAPFQIVRDLDISVAPAVKATVLLDGLLHNGVTIAASRVYGAPLMVNEDIYVVTSSGITDIETSWVSAARGSVLRLRADVDTTGPTPTFSLTPNLIVDNKLGFTSGSAVGVTKSNSKIVITAMDKTGAKASTGGPAGSTSPNQGGGPQVPEVRVQIWQPALR